MPTLRVTLEYDGTGFRGWARQPGLRTVEGVLRQALDAVLPRWEGLAVAGRTDAGVHATGQVASLTADQGLTNRTDPSWSVRQPDGSSYIVYASQTGRTSTIDSVTNAIRSCTSRMRLGLRSPFATRR